MSAEKALIFLSNRSPTENEDYFKKLSIALDLFTHTWSLSVEVQFYLLVPFIFLIGRFFEKSSRQWYNAAIAILSFLFHVSSPASNAFNSVFARIWQFLIGMISYFIVENRENNSVLYKPLETVESETEQLLEDDKIVRESKVSGKILWMKNIVLILSVMIILAPRELTPLGARVFMTVFTGLLIVLDVENFLLNSRFLVYIGDISYALYLIHWPIYAYVKLTYGRNFWILAAAAFLSLLVAAIIKQIYEKIPNRTFPRLDGVEPDMNLDNAEELNNYWNINDNNAPQLQECRHRATTISMYMAVGCEPLAAPRKPIDNGDFSTSWTKECSEKLINFVGFINETQPDYAFILTRWFAVAEPYENGPDNLNNDTIYLEMKSQLRKMLPNIKKKLFILDSFPRAKSKEIERIAEEMKKGRKTMTEINQALYDPKQFEFGRHRHAELVKNECGSKCELIDYVDAFWNKTMNQFQYFDSNGFSYFTTGAHLSAHGLEYVRPIYTEICARL